MGEFPLPPAESRGEAQLTLNLAHLANSFVWPVQLSLLHMLLFKVLIRKYFTQGKCDFLKFLFILSGKIKFLTL
jgi:hypothetical protein